MQASVLHSLRNHKALLNYSAVFFLLFSVFSVWHDTAHALKTEQECELCLSSLDLEHSIPAKVNLFALSTDHFSAIQFSSQHFYSEFVAIAGNRDPPIVILN
ncbi:hypothetical protein NQT72_17930 [Pseudoalteromonas carrageenovora]|uniref:hypothetical protein n=1 Tax=Pseudoalteromonas carrageenovora TaxID=227 RepID=UPI0021184925|nr:hypothetical protein [Pseudoalteromonas carrageenovora]MCQ8891376.1 hypothetical protein [Pseudoalteromonas carrageenovora]